MSDYPNDPQQSGQPGYGRQPDYRAPGNTPTLSPQDERTWGAIAHGAALVAMILLGRLPGLPRLARRLRHLQGPRPLRPRPRGQLGERADHDVHLARHLDPADPAARPGPPHASCAAPFVAGLLHIIGAMKAYQGEWWNPPLTPRFVK